MAENEKFVDKKLNEEELDNVAGGTRADFNAVCNALGKSPTFNSRDGIRDLLWEGWAIKVEHWNTGDWGSKKDAPAQFRDLAGYYSKEADSVMTIDDVVRVIKANPNGLDDRLLKK